MACHPWRDMIEPVLEDEDGTPLLGAVAKTDLWAFLGISYVPQRPREGQGPDRRDGQASARVSRLRRKRRASVKGKGRLTACFVKQGWSGGTMPWISAPTRQNSRNS